MKLTLGEHLNELRSRFLLIAIILFILFILGFSVSNFVINRIKEAIK